MINITLFAFIRVFAKYNQIKKVCKTESYEEIKNIGEIIKYAFIKSLAVNMVIFGFNMISSIS